VGRREKFFGCYCLKQDSWLWPDAEKSDSFCKKWRAYYTIDSWLFHLLEVKVSGCVKGSTPCLMKVMSICRNPYHKTLVNWTIQCSILSLMTDHLTCSGGLHMLHFSELCCTQSGARIKTQCQSNLSVLSSKCLFPHKDGGSPGVLAALWIAIFQPGHVNSNLWPGRQNSGWLHWSMC